MGVYTNATQNPDPVFAFSGFRTALGKPFCVITHFINYVERNC